jgi:hypothetical protein
VITILAELKDKTKNLI